MFQISYERIVGKDFRGVCGSGWNIPELQAVLESVFNEKVEIEAYQLRRHFSQIGERSLLINARAITSDINGDDLVLLGIEDVTVTQDTHEKLKASEIRYRLIARRCLKR